MIYFLLYIIYLFIGFFSAAADSIKAAIFAGIVGLLSLIISRYLEQQRDTRARLATKKIEVYETFFEFFFSALSGTKTGKIISTEEMVEHFIVFQRDLLFWGSDGVIKAWLKFRNVIESANISSGKPPPLALMIAATADLMIEMRRDVGYRFTTINALDFAKMILRVETDDDRRVIDEVSLQNR